MIYEEHKQFKDGFNLWRTVNSLKGWKAQFISQNWY